MEEIIKNMKKSNYVRKCVDKYNRKMVLQYTLKGVFIKEWNTVGEINRELGFDKSAILRCCKGKQKKSYHFIWKFKDDTASLNTKEDKTHGGNSEKLPGAFLEAQVEG